MTRVGLFLTVIALGAMAAAASAAEAAPPRLRPATPPLAAFRTADPALFDAVLATRQAGAFGLDGKDYSGRIPGVNARIDSLRAFVAALVRSGGGNLWYCLLQDGSSLVRQTGSMGWDAAVGDAPGALDLIAGMGMDARGLDVAARRLDSGATRFTVSRDAGARRDATEGEGRPDAGWRAGFDAFMNGPKDSLGAWANARPLVGLLALLSGIDIRSELGARGMGTPSWAQLELFDTRGDLGFEARLDNILPPDVRNSDPSPLVIRGRDAPLLEIAVPDPARLGGLFAFDKDILLLANMDFSALIPRALGASVFRNDRGGMSWNLVCLMPDRARFKTQFDRLRSWLESLSAVPSSPFAIAETNSLLGDTLWRIRVGEVSLVLGVLESGAAGRDGAFAVLASGVEDWPDPRDIRVETGASPCLIRWESNLRRESRADIADALARLSRRNEGTKYPADFFDRLLPERDSGRVFIDAGSLVIRSEHGLLPFLVPAVATMLYDGPRWGQTDPASHESAGRR